MQNAFEEIREQIHDIRNLIGPVHLRMADLETRIVDARRLFEEKVLTLETRLMGALFRLERHDGSIADLLANQKEMLERIQRLEP